MTSFIIFSSFLFGAIIGSFLNALVLRFKTGLSMLSRSRCMVCSSTIAWYDLIPGISYLILSGRCRSCESRISSQYPIVEVLTAVLFAGIVSLYGLTIETFILWIIFSLMILIFVYDYKHKIIPNAFVYPAILFSFINIFIRGNAFSIKFFDVSYLYTAIGLFLFFFMFWFFSRGAWMGLGDAKLAVMIGLLLGPIGGVSATVLGFWIGALVGLLLMAKTRIANKNSDSFGMKTELPFAPFLLIGTWIVFFFNVNIF